MFAPWVDTAFIIDIETSGLDSMRNEVLSLSVSAVAIENHQELDSELFLFKPVRKQYWQDGAEAVHGISWEQSQEFPSAKKQWKKFLSFLKAYAHKPQVMGCHALWFGKYFDSSFIDCQLDLQELLFEKRKYIGSTFSTLSLAKNAAKKGHLSTEKYSLDALCSIHKIPLKHHDATSDREACQKLFKIYNQLGAIDEHTDYEYLPPSLTQEEEDKRNAKIQKRSNSKRVNR